MLAKEKQTRARTTARRRAFLLTRTMENQGKIASLREQGRRMQLQFGMRSEPVLAKSREIDAVFEEEARIGALLKKLEEPRG